MKKFLSHFIEFDDEKTEPISNSPTNLNSVHTPYETQKISVSGENNSQIDSHFEDLFTEANLPGPDYYELTKTMKTLEPHIPIQSNRLKAAYATLQTQGLTKEVLVSSAKKYIEIVKLDSDQVKSAAADKTKIDIEAKKLRASEIEGEIANLEKKITEMKLEKESLIKSAIEAENKINSRLSDYQIKSTSAIKKIENDINEITNNL